MSFGTLQMKDFFFTNNLASFIDETINQPNEGSPNLNAWKHSDSIINDWLTKSMKKEIQNSFKYARTTQKILNDLEERFGKESAPCV